MAAMAPLRLSTPLVCLQGWLLTRVSYVSCSPVFGGTSLLIASHVCLSSAKLMPMFRRVNGF
jgi:hypothetical protein